VVGHNAKIGAGSIVLKPVPPNATVVGVPGRVVRIKGVRVDDLDQTLPDPVTNDIAMLKQEIEKLNEKIEKLEQEKKI
jgi:serine O-acetyltransferase